MPLVRQGVQCRARPRPGRLGQGRDGHGRGGRPKPPVPRGRSRPAADARRADAGPGGDPAGTTARARRLLLRPRWRRRGTRHPHARLAVVWVDAHGDLNTPATSPSGNEWGMPLRMLIDGGAVRSGDVALVGARNLDPPEQRYVEEIGLPLGADGVQQALEDADAVYVAFDVDALDPTDAIVPFMPEPGGPSLADAEVLLHRVAGARPLAGVGFTGLVADQRNVSALARLCAALGL